MLTFHRITKRFDGHVALRDVTVSVRDGSRTAVVGVNGVGKTTLLRIAAGEVPPDSGQVRVDGAVAYVPQDYRALGAQRVVDYARARAGVLGLERRLRQLERALAAGRHDAADAYGDVLARFDALGGWEVDGRIAAAFARVGLADGLLERRMASLSGGEQVRVGLAGVLASRFDCYLLDEPTNNLDLPALEALEEFVASADATFLLVSHDRAFLDAVATDVIEIDEHQRTAEAYRVGYAEYRRLREQALAAAQARYRTYTDEVGRLRAAAAAQAATAGRRHDRRPPRDGDKFAPHFFAARQAQQAARAKRRLHQRLERLEAVEEPRTGWELRLSLEAGASSGDVVVDAVDVVARVGGFRLGPLSLSVRRGERVAVAGRNGAGKSTLLSLLAGTRAPDSGSVRHGPSVRVGVLRQGGLDLAGHHRTTASGAGSSPEPTGLEVFRRTLGWNASDARTLLAKFDLRAAHVLRSVTSYSPGERCRLGLAILTAQGANFLLLDEPTNHLDLEASEQLEQALAGFEGTLVVVSHDRAFLAGLAPTRHVELVGGRIAHDGPA